MADLFVSSSHGDAPLVDRCVAWLRYFGVTVCVAGADDSVAEASSCRAAVFFLSEPSFDDAPLLQQIHDVAMTDKPVMLVLADDIHLSRLRSLPVLEVQSLPARGLSTQQIGEALVKLFPAMSVLRAPLRVAERPTKPNEFRRVAVWQARARFAAMALIVLSVAYFVRTQSIKQASTPPPEMPIAQTAPDAAPPAPAPGVVPMPVATPAPHAPVLDTPPKAATREERAVEFVQQCIASTARDHGQTDEQIERVIAFFDDPVFIDGKGLQPRQLVRTSMELRQREMPRWHEAVESIHVEPTGEATVVRVFTRTSFVGENAQGEQVSKGFMTARYVVRFDSNDRMQIARIDDMKETPTL